MDGFCLQGELDLTLFYKIEGYWGIFFEKPKSLMTENDRDLNDRDLNDRKTPLNIYLFFWWNSFLVLAIASVALSWVSISNGLWWYCTILTPTELCLFFSSMHWMIKSGFADFDVGALSKFSTYYIPLPQQLASFAWYFHVVEGISQSQTLEYRFGRYLPVFFAHVHKMLQSCLTANQIYSR